MRNVRALMLVMLMAGAGACSAYVRPDGSTAVYFHTAPPPLRVEVRSARPSAQHVWVAGHWVGRDGNYEWEPGKWVLVEAGHRSWVAGQWRHDRNGWFWVDGHWR